MEFKRIATYRDFLGELTVNYKRTEKPIVKLNSSRDAADFMRPYFEEPMDDHEEFKLIHLNNGNCVVNVHHLSTGGETGVTADVRMAVRNALVIKTQAIILMHNHPSGTLMLSKADRDVTKKFKQAFAYFDIAVLDHIIITREDYFSMADEGVF